MWTRRWFLQRRRSDPIAAEMRERVADLLSIKPADVGIKAKTPEGLNADHVAQAHAVVLLEKVEDADELGAMTASIESQQQLEDVVQDLVSQVHGLEPSSGHRSRSSIQKTSPKSGPNK